MTINNKGPHTLVSQGSRAARSQFDREGHAPSYNPQWVKLYLQNISRIDLLKNKGLITGLLHPLFHLRHWTPPKTSISA